MLGHFPFRPLCDSADSASSGAPVISPVRDADMCMYLPLHEHWCTPARRQSSKQRRQRLPPGGRDGAGTVAMVDAYSAGSWVGCLALTHFDWR